MVFGSCSQQVVFEGSHALLRSRPVSPSEAVAHTQFLGEGDQELVHQEKGGRGGRGRGGVGSGLASGSRGRR